MRKTSIKDPEEYIFSYFPLPSPSVTLSLFILPPTSWWPLWPIYFFIVQYYKCMQTHIVLYYLQPGVKRSHFLSVSLLSPSFVLSHWGLTVEDVPVVLCMAALIKKPVRATRVKNKPCLLFSHFLFRSPWPPKVSLRYAHFFWEHICFAQEHSEQLHQSESALQ